MVLSLLQMELMSSLCTCLSAQDLQRYITGHFQSKGLSGEVLLILRALRVDKRCPGLGHCVHGLTLACFHSDKGTGKMGIFETCFYN